MKKFQLFHKCLPVLCSGFFFCLLLITNNSHARGLFDNLNNIDLSKLEQVGQKLAQSSEKSEEEEMEIGEHMAGTLVGAVPLDTNSKAQAYVNKVGRWLSLHSERPDIPWQFGVLNDNDLNAFAAPGGYVFITRGMLDKLDNEAELAGVLAHEIQHVTHKHYLKAAQKNNLIGAASDIGMMLGNSSGRTSAEQREINERLLNASKQLYARGLDKDDELEADRDALQLMTRAGYDPYAFVAVMQKLDAQGASDSKMALLLATHPTPADRLVSLGTSINNLKIPANAATLENRFQQALR